MSPGDVLPSLVELSIAVAGFSGVVAALSPNRPSHWTLSARALFGALLVSTLVSAGLSVFAMVLLAAPVLPATAWAATSAAHAVLLTAVLVVRGAQIRSQLPRGTAPPTWTVVSLSAVVVIAAFQVANGVAFQAGWLCVAGLGLYAFFGFLFFILLVTELWSEEHAA